MKDMRIKDMTIKEYVIMKKDMVMEKKPITGGRYMKDFKDEKLYLIHLIFQAMNKRQSENPPENLKWEVLYNLAYYHKVSNIIYYSLKDVKDKYNIPEDIWQKICSDYKKGIAKEAMQHAMTEMLLEEFEKNQIECIPLKGYVLKNFYPKLDMRTMGDIDIFYNEDKTPKVRKIMKSMGYDIVKIEDKHDKYYKKPFMTLEMHKSLMGTVEPYASYYKDIWGKIKPMENLKYIHEFSKEDFYIFLMVHFTKHFKNCGTGVRSVLDIWVYNKKFYNDMDWDYIKCELKKIKLDEFEENIRGLSKFWFENEMFEDKNSELYSLIGDYILSSGVYGTIKNSVIVAMSKKFEGKKPAKKLKYLYGLRVIFPDLNGMKKRFNILNRFPFLLPVFWVFRLVRAFFFRRERAFKSVESVYSASDKELMQILDLHKKVGLYKTEQTF
jgi:hypothetical protein